MLKANPGVRYPGAFFVASDVVTVGECCLGQSVVELAAICVSLGVAYSIVGGEIFMEITTPDLMDECQGEAPAPTAIATEPMTDFDANEVTGTLFGASTGELWVGDASTFEASVVKVEQTVDVWGDLSVTFTAVRGGLPAVPTPVWLFVFNACGRSNSPGFETSFTAE